MCLHIQVSKVKSRRNTKEKLGILVKTIIIRPKETFEPIDRSLRDSCKVVLVIHVVKSKTMCIAKIPLPVI